MQRSEPSMMRLPTASSATASEKRTLQHSGGILNQLPLQKCNIGRRVITAVSWFSPSDEHIGVLCS